MRVPEIYSAAAAEALRARLPLRQPARRARPLPAIFHVGIDPAQAVFEDRQLFRPHAGDGDRFIIPRDRYEARHLRLALGGELDHDFARRVRRARTRHDAHGHEPRHQPRQRRDVDAGHVGEVDLALATAARQQRHDTPHRDAQPIRRQRFGAELLGNDVADPVDQVGQVIVEIERGFHHCVP